MQADSLNTSFDTLVAESIIDSPVADTPAVANDSAGESLVELAEEVVVKSPKSTEMPAVTQLNVSESVVQVQSKDKLPIESTEQSPIHLFANLKDADSAKYSITPQTISGFKTQSGATQVIPIEKYSVRVFEKEWVFGISVFAVLLIIIVRIFYQKFLSSIISSLVNLQLAEKLLRERNVLYRRVNFLLNICFVLSVSFLVYVTAERYHINGPSNNSFSNFMFINLVVTGVLVIRIFFTKITGAIFDSVPVFKEYLHNSLVVYKNVGLYLLPLMVSYFFVSETLAPVIYVFGVILFIGALLMRYIKAVQIIIKHNVFLFYSILYLCTLEILPTLIGIKFVLTLR